MNIVHSTMVGHCQGCEYDYVLELRIFSLISDFFFFFFFFFFFDRSIHHMQLLSCLNA